MSTVLSGIPFSDHRAAAWRWLPVAIGALVLFVPTWITLWNGLWNEEAYEHGPIILGVFFWLLWSRRADFLTPTGASAPVAGGVALVLGLFMYFVGRTQQLPLFEVSAQLPIVAGALLVVDGWPAVRRHWFALLFLVFMIPLPPFVVLGITGELKQHVSAVAEILLYNAGYPIARNGVVITVGQYQMLVADACSGLNSMYSLSAMGLLYMYIVRRPSLVHNALLLAAILPAAFAANVIRVVLLILLTYHFGDEVGQGFLHGLSGMLLFICALAVLFVLDAALARLFVRARRSSGGAHVG